jgi:polysaccharide deacetylase family protein (PEP-CTERM system associated)
MKTFLFSVDLEDVRLWMPHGEHHEPRVAHNTYRYLDWLAKHKAHCTFFCVGQVAALYPGLIQEIYAQGHEIALHSHTHRPLESLGPEGFARDLELNLQAVHKAGVPKVVGYRAPIFSLTSETSWAYPILAKAGIVYSSSVLPAQNPLYGWAEFGTEPKCLDRVWELPMSVSSIGLLKIPPAGGTYLRLLPTSIAKRLFNNAGETVLGYLHPYDIDTKQERFNHPGLERAPWANRLMYVGRKNLFDKLDALLSTGTIIKRYDAFVRELDSSLST